MNRERKSSMRTWMTDLGVVAALAVTIAACSATSETAPDPAVDTGATTAAGAGGDPNVLLVPHLCVAYDVGPTHTCTCTPKCVEETNPSNAASPALCHCGARWSDPYADAERSGSLRYVDTCHFSHCCKSGDTCDCSDDSASTCPAGTALVDHCGPEDFDESAYLASRQLTRPVRVDDCTGR